MNDLSSNDFDHALLVEVTEQISGALNLEIDPSLVDPDTPLYGDGLGLDSIDILEIALVLSKRYGVSLRADNEDNVRIFSTLRNLTDYVVAHRTQ